MHSWTAMLLSYARHANVRRRSSEAGLSRRDLKFPARNDMSQSSYLLGVALTICLCLFSQLLGWSFRCNTTWLLWSLLVRSYHAVEIMAFSRWRFLIICSWAA